MTLPVKLLAFGIATKGRLPILTRMSKSFNAAAPLRRFGEPTIPRPGTGQPIKSD
jgi:hypothetical protein